MDTATLIRGWFCGRGEDMALFKPAPGAGTSRAELWLQMLLHLKNIFESIQTNK